MFYGYPATVGSSFGFGKPAFGFAKSPAGAFGKPFAKGIPGFPGATVAGGQGFAVPATTVATSPFPI
jgi:hypothetical protein